MDASAIRGEPGRGWSVAVGAIIGGAALSAIIGIAFMLTVGRAEDRVVAQYLDNAMTTERLRSAADRESSAARAFLLTRDSGSLERAHRGRAAFASDITRLRDQQLSEEEESLVDQIEASDELYRAALDHALALAGANASEERVRAELEQTVVPAKRELDDLLIRLATRADREASVAQQASLEARSRAVRVLATVGVLAVGLAVALGVLLYRALAKLGRDGVELAGSLARVEQSNRDLDAFAGRVAHDLRNALAPTLVSVDLLRSSASSPERLRTICDKLDRANRRAIGIIDALLAFSRGSAPAEEGATCSVLDVLGDVLEQIAPLIAQNDVRIEQAITEVQVSCPPGLLHAVLANVVGNAVKFLQGAATRVVSISATTAGEGCEIRVEDTGPGIPPELRERVFEPFFRVPGAKAPGTGIGLATVRRILDAQGGRALATSSKSGGTAIVLWLPQPRLSLDAASTPQPAPLH